MVSYETPVVDLLSVTQAIFVRLALATVATSLAKGGSSERSCPDEALGLGREEPSFDHTRHSHRGRRNRVSSYSPARANARGLLGCDRHFGRNAIYSWRYANAVGRADRGDRGGCVGGSDRSKFLWRESRCLCGRDCSHRIALDRVSSGEDRVSLRQHYPRYHRSDSAVGAGVDYRAPPIPRSLSRNYGSSRCRRPLARTSTERGEKCG